MGTVPFKVEWSRPIPSARKAQHRLHPLISQTDAYGRAVRAGELLLILPSCILVALVLVQAFAGNGSPTIHRPAAMMAAGPTVPAALVSAAPGPRSELINIEAQRP
ncbi:MAG: hypothetical protein ACP5O1_07630 [Phycisphaerae bacterium]